MNSSAFILIFLSNVNTAQGSVRKCVHKYIQHDPTPHQPQQSFVSEMLFKTYIILCAAMPSVLHGFIFFNTFAIAAAAPTQIKLTAEKKVVQIQNVKYKRTSPSYNIKCGDYI